MHITSDRRWFWFGIASIAFAVFDLATGSYGLAAFQLVIAGYLLLD